jgi:hypothetical protein
MRPFNGSAEVLRFLVRFETAWQAFELRAVMEYLRMRFLMAQHEGRPYSLKGRTPRSLRRDMEAFQQMILADPVLRANVERRGPYIPANWPPSGHAGARYRREEERYQIVELTGRAALEQEGSVLAHCVGGYAHQCASGYNSIWSLRSIEGTQAKPLVTIQVENRRTIVQARGYQNRPASPSEMYLIHAWARKAGLRVSSQA